MILDVNEVCSQIDTEIAVFIHNIILIIKIAVPIILIIFGMLDLGKAVVASKEDEIKKGQNTFIKRLIAGVVVFFMISIAQLITSLIDKETKGGFWSCANSLMNGTVNQTESKTSKNGKEEDIKDKNPSAFQYCCEQYDGTVKGTQCTNINGNRISSEKIVSCVENMDKDIKEKYKDETKKCCESLGGSYSSNDCRDHNGGSISQNNISNCVVNEINKTDKDLFDTCCREKGGNPGNGTCIDNNGGTISNQSINSCIFSKID